MKILRKTADRYIWNENRKTSDKTEKMFSKKIILLGDDDIFDRHLVKAGNEIKLNITSCFNLSDFWIMLSKNKNNILTIVMDFKFIELMKASLRLKLIKNMPVFILYNNSQRVKSSISKLPFFYPTFVHKKYGVTAVVDSLFLYRKQLIDGKKALIS